MIESDGDDDDAGSAGAAGSGAGKSGGAGTAGVSGTGGSSGSSGASGASGASGTGGSGGSGGSVSSECGLLVGPAEAEPNGDTTTATAYGLGVATHGCIVDADLDTYSFTTPADNTGGGVLIEFTEVGKGSATPLGTLGVSVLTEGDNAALYSTYNPNAGGNVSAYFAAAPGRTYYVQVGAFGSGEGKFVYTMKATYTPVADAFEPNDSFDTATPIGLGTSYSGYYFTGYINATAPTVERLYDIYAVPLNAGNVKINLADLPAEFTAAVRVFDPTRTQTGDYGYNSAPGGALTYEFTAATAGTYYLRVEDFGSAPFAGNATALPEHFTKPYRLTVTQP